MNYIIFIALLFLSLSGFTQSLGTTQGTTRAVVIGISDYEDPLITDLKYAHQDAGAFTQYLQSKAGGNIPPDQILLLQNEAATVAQIHSALDWLLQESRETDQAIIYFSGHGDVETKTIRQRGYLLAYDTPASNYRAGAIRLGDINDVVATLSQQNKSKLILITDACRSGRLAGSSINGPQATAAALATQFANEVKIMSCQPDEYSLEGQEWNGGAFSYHLLDGLRGLADRNNDLKVSLLELERYLEDQVPADTDPHRQIPMLIGNKGTTLAFVDEEELVYLKMEKAGQGPSLAMVEMKGFEDLVLEKLDSNLLEDYRAFNAAIADQYFLPRDYGADRTLGKSAEELYERLSKAPELKTLHAAMRRNFAAALQDESQRSINAYLRTDPDEMKKRYYTFGAEYEANPAYLARAAELLGPAHYLYPRIKAKQHYFEGLIYRLKGERDARPELFDTAFVLVQKAQEYDPEAAFIYNELGMIKENSREFSAAIPYFEQARALAPTWELPPTNMSIVYRILRQHEKADSMGRKVIEINPAYYGIYGFLAINYAIQNKNEEAKKMYLLSLKYNPGHLMSLYNLGDLLLEEKQYDEARKYLERAVVIDSTYFYGQYGLAFYYSNLGMVDSAIIQFQKAIACDTAQLLPYMWLAYEYMYDNQFPAALETLQRLHEISPGYFEYHFGMSCWHALQGNTNEGLDALESAIKAGLPYDRIPDDDDIDRLRDTKRYQEILEQYFPDQ